MTNAPRIHSTMPLLLSFTEAEQLKRELKSLKSWDLSHRQLCDLELILNGGFSPLTGFLTRADYDSVVREMRLASGALWPIPVMLDVSQKFADSLAPGEKIALRDPEGVPLAILQVESVYAPERSHEATQVYGTSDPAHAGVKALFTDTHPACVGGEVQGLELPTHFDFNHLRLTPRELKDTFARLGWSRVVGFQTRNPMHRAHLELTLRAARAADANLLLHPVAGMTKPGDIDHYSRVRCYEHLLKYYPEHSAVLALIPLAMRMAGPREALWHAIIRKNYGCTHFIVGRDHAGPGKHKTGREYYSPYAAQELALRYEDEIGIKIIPFQEMVYVAERGEYVAEEEVEANERVLKLSGTEFRRRLREAIEIPSWFSYPEIVTELKKTHPPKLQQGMTIFFTGLPCAGKSTLAKAVLAKLLENGVRSVTLLDGDIVRKNLSSELTFS
ncbi:MAG: sulfate adenylyltransferase, partial [Burkholderiales bacterium]